MPGGMLSGVADTGCGCPNGPNGSNCGFHSRPFAFCPMVPKPPNGHRPSLTVRTGVLASAARQRLRPPRTAVRRLRQLVQRLAAAHVARWPAAGRCLRRPPIRETRANRQGCSPGRQKEGLSRAAAHRTSAAESRVDARFFPCRIQLSRQRSGCRAEMGPSCPHRATEYRPARKNRRD